MGPEPAAALDGLPLASLVLAADGSVITVNEAWAGLSGIPLDESGGDGWLRAVEPLDREGLRLRLRKAAGGAGRGSADWRLIGPEGRRWSRWWWTPGLADGLVACVADIDDDKAREFDLWRRASHGPLTRLVDRYQFVNMANWALRHRNRTGALVAVVVVDVAGFGNGDGADHQHAPESASRAAARRMLAAVGPADIAARVGSDEFAILYKDLPDAGEAERAAGRLRRATQRPGAMDEMPRSVATVVGAAVASRPGDTAETLLAVARAAVRDAERAGAGPSWPVVRGYPESLPAPRRDGDHEAAAGPDGAPDVRDAAAVTELAAMTVQRISGVAMTLASAMSLIEGRAAARVGRAADELDDLIRQVRLMALQLRSSPAPPGAAGPGEAEGRAGRPGSADRSALSG